MSFLGSLKTMISRNRPDRAAPSSSKPQKQFVSNDPGPAPTPATTETATTQPVPETRAIDWRILFVSADSFWFDQIEREIRPLQPAWLCECVADGAGATARLKTSSVHVLVLDGRVPDAAGVLQELATRSARTLCLVRCDLSDRSAVTQWNRLGATPIPGNLDASGLVASLKRAEHLRDWMGEHAMKELLPRIRKLPAAPQLHAQVTEELQSPNGSVEVIAHFIAHDPVMSAKMLQVVNSAFFSRAHEVTDITEAVMVLGTERIRSLILLAGVFSQYDAVKCAGFSPQTVWSHSLQVGSYARAIVLGETKDRKIAEAAFTAGLLHDIGKLVLAANLPDMYEAVRQMRLAKKIPEREAEQMVLGTTHALLGACLLGTWGLPLPILEAIAWHHEPERSAEKGFSPLAAVHVANVFAHDCDWGSGEDATPEHIHAAWLVNNGLGNCAERWRQLCGITARPPEATVVEEDVRRRQDARKN